MLDAVDVSVQPPVGVQLARPEPHTAKEPKDPLAVGAGVHSREPGYGAAAQQQVGARVAILVVVLCRKTERAFCNPPGL